MINDNEIWQVDVNGQIYETNFAGLAEWINEGSLLPQDKVRRGNLRWLEAGKISMLYGFFNAKELGVPLPVVPTTTNQAVEQSSTTETVNSVTNIVSQPNVIETAAIETVGQNFQTAIQPNLPPPPQNTNVCARHADADPVYVCESCDNVFCKACPSSYGSVKICPFCDAMCKKLDEVVKKKQQTIQYQAAVSQGFGFTDFGNAVAYPFRFKVSLVLGALMFMFFTLGRSAPAIGGFYMYAATLFCMLLANTLTFGILANTVENMAQGKIELDFMPSFDEFSIWDDVVHPFFLSIGVYLISFGVLIAIIIGGIWYSLRSITSQTNKVLIERAQQIGDAKREGTITQNGEIPVRQEENTPEQQRALEDGDMPKFMQLKQEQRQKEFESTSAFSPESEQLESQAIRENLLKLGIPILLLAFLSFLWGIFYFPAACAVAGYTRSFAAVVNPSVGLDTIKHLGFDYVKILFMCAILVIFTLVLSVFLELIFSPLNLPRIGNFPAIIIGSLFQFYIWIVFSLIIGYALFKNSARLFQKS